MAHLIESFRGALLGAAVGDALGAPFEGRPTVAPAEFARLAASDAPLRYTDDTHMTLVLAEALIDDDELTDQGRLLGAFAAAYDEEPWRGYGPGPPEVFRLFARGVGWRLAASSLHGGRGSLGNGAAMRVAPVGLAAHDDRVAVAARARRSAEVTHAHAIGREAAALQALAVTEALASAGAELDPEAVLDALEGAIRSTLLLERLRRVRRALDGEDIGSLIGAGVEAHEAVPAALAVFLRRPDSFAAAIADAVGLGGDTDTIASMVGALSGARLGASAIPGGWIARLEGADRIRVTAELLHDLWEDRRSR